MHERERSRRSWARWLAPAAALAGAAMAPAGALADAAPSAVRTAHAGDGVFVDVAQPRLSWQDPGAGQSAYELAVSDGRRTVWDSGRVASSQETDVSYGGPPLASDGSYQWSV